VLVLLIVLIVTNLVTLGVLAWYALRPVVHPHPDVEMVAALTESRSPSSTRRLITIEILNPIELAGSRNRWAGVAGALAPGITHRLVHDLILKSLRRQLAEQRVVADVRLHVIEPAPDAAPVDLVKQQEQRQR
jgi:hypothetical protein